MPPFCSSFAAGKMAYMVLRSRSGEHPSSFSVPSTCTPNSVTVVSPSTYLLQSILPHYPKLAGQRFQRLVLICPLPVLDLGRQEVVEMAERTPFSTPTLDSKISREIACVIPTDDDHPMGRTTHVGRYQAVGSKPASAISAPVAFSN